MSKLPFTIDMRDVAHAISDRPSKLAYLLNEILYYRDGEQGNCFVDELIADLDAATKRMISTIAKAIEAESGGGI